MKLPILLITNNIKDLFTSSKIINKVSRSLNTELKFSLHFVVDDH